MGRIRTVKPELFLDEELGALSGDHLALFVGLWTIADREGRLHWRPARIKATLFPYRTVDVEALAAKLDEIGKIQLYEVDGERYLWVCGFIRHQRPHPKEPAGDLPEPPSREKKRQAVDGNGEVRMLPVESRGKGREGKGREGASGKAAAADFALTPTPAKVPRAPSPQERIYALVAHNRTAVLGDVVPDDELDVATINRIFETRIREASEEAVLEAHTLFCQDEFALSRSPACPVRLFASQWNRWLDAAMKARAAGGAA